MNLCERLTEELHQRGVRVLVGRRSRCHMSIACFTPPIGRHLAVVSVNPGIESDADIAEALAIHLALLVQSGGVKRFRLTDENRNAFWMGRAWRSAARLSISDAEWEAAMAEHIEGHEIEERFGVTRRIARTRLNVWFAKRGNIGPLLADRIDVSMTYREQPSMWCEVL